MIGDCNCRECGNHENNINMNLYKSLEYLIYRDFYDLYLIENEDIL